MKMLRGYMVAAALGLAALGASPAHADLYIYCPSSEAGCSQNGAYLAHNTSNTITGFGGQNGGAVGDFTISVGMTGDLSSGGNLADTSNLDISSTSSGQTLNLFFTETNLTAGTAAQFLMDFTGTEVVGFTVTRSFYLDASNGFGTGTLLGSCSNALSCGYMESVVESLSGQFSITEEVAITEGDCADIQGGCYLSTDDNVRIPEPGALSLFGVGLLALGAYSRRRKAAAVV